MMHALTLLLLAFLAQPETFRFAWLSDTHVGSETGAQDLRAAVHDINALSGIRFVIVSGDVTEFGADEQFVTARTILDSLTVPYHIIPGNHDMKWSESGGTTFDRLWGQERFAFESGGIRFLGFHEGPRMRMADGFFAPEDLRWLDSTLAVMPDTTQPLMVVTHYPLDSGIANWYEAVDRLKRRNTTMVFVGHGHRNRIDSYEGLPGLMGRSSLRAGKPAGGFNVVTITPDSVIVAEHAVGGATAGPWFAGARRRGMPAGDGAYPRPDFRVNDQYTLVQRRWTWSAGWTVANAPAVEAGMVITGDASGRVTALKADDGRRLWEFRTKGPIYGAPAFAGRRVVAGSADGSIYCLARSTGKVLWKTRTDGPVLSVPAVSGDTVYVGGSDRRFRALDARTGAVLWMSDSLQGFVETRPLVTSGLVIFGAWDGHLYALDARTGRMRWTWQGDQQGVLLSPAACWPVASHGRVFIVAPDRKMTAIDIATGRTIWRTSRFQVRESIGRSVDGARIYVRTMRDSIVAIDPGEDSCKAVWSTACGFGYDINSAMLVESGGTLFYGTKNGLVLALDGVSGKILWKHRVGVGLVNTIAPVDRRRIVLTNFEGTVQCLEEQ